MPDMQSKTRITLQYGSSATGTNAVTWPGGPGTFSAEASWGGGTVTLQVQTPLQTWVAVGPDTTMTANGIAGFVLPKGAKIQAAIATATAVYAYVTPLE